MPIPSNPLQPSPLPELDNVEYARLRTMTDHKQETHKPPHSQNENRAAQGPGPDTLHHEPRTTFFINRKREE